MKVLKIDGTNALIGFDDGHTESFALTCFNYTPMVGDVVTIYNKDSNPIIVKAETANTQQQGNNGAGSQNVYVNVNQTVPNTKPVNKIAYCLICLFFGGLGFHQFLAGKIGSGLLMLFFCWTWIPAIIALIQLIKALCTPADANGMIYV